MRERLALLVFASILIVGCGPSQAAVATAIARTQAAAPTKTLIPPSAPATLTPSPSHTATPTATSTPDSRTIDSDPQTLLCTADDMPKEGKYFLPNRYWIGRTTNPEIVSGWGVEEGRKYLEDTGRIEGWFVSLSRGTSTVNMPEEIWCNVVSYETIQGAQISHSKYSDQVFEDYTEVQGVLQVGDLTRAYRKDEMQPGGERRAWYLITFSYRNFIGSVESWGWEDEVTPEFTEQIARILLAKLEAAPLANP